MPIFHRFCEKRSKERAKAHGVKNEWALGREWDQRERESAQNKYDGTEMRCSVVWGVGPVWKCAYERQCHGTGKKRRKIMCACVGNISLDNAWCVQPVCVCVCHIHIVSYAELECSNKSEFNGQISMVSHVYSYPSAVSTMKGSDATKTEWKHSDSATHFARRLLPSNKRRILPMFYGIILTIQ